MISGSVERSGRQPRSVRMAAASQTSTGAGPYVGSCSVTMDADKSITIVADYVA